TITGSIILSMDPHLGRQATHSYAYVVQLLGMFSVTAAAADSPRVLKGRKIQELLAYLLVFRERPHHRETLAGALWPKSTTEQSRKYLRQGVWQLRGLVAPEAAPAPLVLTDGEWIQANAGSVRLDVAELEEAFAPVRVIPAER